MHKSALHSPIVFIAGPALGHIGRLYVIARALRALCDRPIVFVTPDFARYGETVLSGEFDLIRVPIPPEAKRQPAQAFADGLEEVLESLAPRAIVTDMCPLRWLVAMRFPDCPRIMVTNFFLTGTLDAQTVQKQRLESEAADIGAMRARRGLPEITNAFDLYEADQVLLADPPSFLAGIQARPDHHIVTGPCCWSKDGEMPSELSSISDIFLMSMGSTGRDFFDQNMSRKVADWAGAGPSVYVGNQCKSIRDLQITDLCFDWLPLKEALSKTRVTITHGGAGSSYLALEHGVPVVTMATHQNQRILGEYLENMGLGVCINDPEDLVKLERLHFDVIQRNAKQTANELAQIDGAKNAAQRINAFA